jgi:hypothetical protein
LKRPKCGGQAAGADFLAGDRGIHLSDHGSMSGATERQEAGGRALTLGAILALGLVTLPVQGAQILVIGDSWATNMAIPMTRSG